LQVRDFTADTFRPHIGSTFQLTMSDGRVFDLELEDVEVLLPKEQTPRKQRDSFGIYLLGPEDVMIKAGTYPTRHDVLGGPFQLYFVPIARRDNGRHLYESIFT
jgi:hypothetical protein